jgi:hypothetical protein
MNETSMEFLFDEFATRYQRGELPDVREYLERAGPEREDLGRLIDRFLEAVPARESTEEEIVLMQARLEQQPPILLLRLRRKLSREAVVDALVTTLGVDPAKNKKVGGYYHRLETGLLDPKGVDRRVWDALAEFLHANVRGLAGFRPAPPAAPAVSYQRYPGIEFQESISYSRTPAEEEEPDEIDRLFTAGA